MLFILPHLVTIPSAPFDKRSLVPICLMAPQSLMVPHVCLFGAHTCLMVPQSLMAPQSLYGAPEPHGAPHALRHPTCLMVPLCLFGTHICLLAPHLPFASPICLLGPQFVLKRPMAKCPAAKRGPGFQFPGCNSWMTLSSCTTTNQLYHLLLQLFAASFPRVRMCLNRSHHFVWAHKRDFSLRFHMESVSVMSQESQIFGWESTHKSCVLLLA
jgi:hypothetical protein